ncbi:MULTISPECIES: crotonyl-CoA carboxylase/reductase [Streptomyces]|uniref:crotonyl-CoA carboxylase/reductase n=1 Tax=Streptomyces TaxID=1883 RepID=UPI0006E3BDBD|nr:crotonyl-CoA carboxylase/reductase [Streptomyces prasinus]
MSQPLYELGDPPPLGVVPERMYANVIRQDRFGEPVKAMQTEVLPVPRPGRGEVLVYVMAAGINYNNVWASLGEPIDVIAMRQKLHGAVEDFHIGGTDASGVVWAVGEGVTQFEVGDEVVTSGAIWDETAEDVRMGVDPLASKSLTAWGYESNYGSFAQFTRVKEQQCHPKPANLSWEQAGSFLVTGATAYRQLTNWAPHDVRPGDPVLIWGGSGGVGSAAIQITNLRGGIPIAVVSSQERAEYALALGAKGVIDRTGFSHWGRLPDLDDRAATKAWTAEARRFGAEFWKVLGERRNPRIVVEHPGEETLPTSMFVCDNAGMVVICGGTSGYNGDLDLRYLWMRSKRLQGSHGSNTRENRAVIRLMSEGRLDPCITWCGTFDQIAEGHQTLYENRQGTGNFAVLVNAASHGLTTLSGVG